MDRPPLRQAGDHSYSLGGSYAALGTLVAHHHRELSGEGQQVNASLIESLIQLYFALPYQWEDGKVLQLRGGFFKDTDGDIKQDDISFPNDWQCKDGRFEFGILGNLRLLNPRMLTRFHAMIQWMIEDGVEVGELAEINWEALDLSMLTPERIKNWTSIIDGFFAKHTREELFEGAMVRGFSLNPILDMAEVLKNEQLEARGLWQEAEHPELGRKVHYPGHLFLSSETENPDPERAPHVGEDNERVYGQELGLSAQEVASLKEAGII
jgi:crotonobetainyl-CoA:carnitine CoA-transferase CaiB-like acyl-CoA transferase